MWFIMHWRVKSVKKSSSRPKLLKMELHRSCCILWLTNICLEKHSLVEKIYFLAFSVLPAFSLKMIQNGVKTRKKSNVRDFEVQVEHSELSTLRPALIILTIECLARLSRHSLIETLNTFRWQWITSICWNIFVSE